ncbi:MAG TPA: hypothetical protein VEA81_00170 [Burkholderiaceae bacterium]|nr:hypothetical protein [Burkholderiaceae bacterium]
MSGPDLREEARIALDALVMVQRYFRDTDVPDADKVVAELQPIIDRVIVALAAAEGAEARRSEPVAWIDRHELTQIGRDGFEPTVSGAPVSEHDVPLYTHPPA